MNESCRYRKSDHSILYIMVFIILLSCCEQEHKVTQMQRTIHDLESHLQKIDTTLTKIIQHQPL